MKAETTTKALHELDDETIALWREDLRVRQALAEQENDRRATEQEKHHRARFVEIAAERLRVDIGPASELESDGSFRFAVRGEIVALWMDAGWSLNAGPPCPECNEVVHRGYATAVRDHDDIVERVGLPPKLCSACEESQPVAPPVAPRALVEVDADYGMLRIGNHWLAPAAVVRVEGNREDPSIAEITLADGCRYSARKTPPTEVVRLLDLALAQRRGGSYDE